jgi:hypothetical protein
LVKQCRFLINWLILNFNLRKMKIRLLVLVCCSLLVNNSFAQWSPTSGPDGGTASCFESNGTDL